MHTILFSMLATLLLFRCTTIDCALKSRDTFVVSTQYGPVRGNRRVSCVGEQFYSFRGIPYAKPPVGELRFKDPQPPDPWTRPIDVTQPGNIAMAFELLNKHGDQQHITANCNEDCLLLNVYTKHLRPTKPRPVMVFIHGGNFFRGSGAERLYGFDYFLQHNVVCVSFNYRLGALGFLSLPDPAVGVPGNAGLKDQTLALKWVRQNIHRFGGDRHSVTVFGQSAGSGSIQFHMLSSNSRGLFDRAILESGTVLYSLCSYVQINWAFRLASRLGWAGDERDSRGIHAFLLTANATTIVEQQELLVEAGDPVQDCYPFQPQREPFDSEQMVFMTTENDLANGPTWGDDIPLLIGGTLDEGYVSYSSLSGITNIADVRDIATNFLPPDVLRIKGPQAVQHAMDRYGLVDGLDIGEWKMALMRLWGDYFIWLGIHATIESRWRNAGTGRTYLYQFAKDSRRMDQMKKLLMETNVDIPGVCHAEDLRYLFNSRIFRRALANSSEAWMVDRMTTMWTQFAATGVPTTMRSWEPVDGRDHPYYRAYLIDDVCDMETLPLTDRLVFLRELLSIE